MIDQTPRRFDPERVRARAAAHNFEATPEKIEALFASGALSWRDGRVIAKYPPSPERARLAELVTQSAALDAAKPQPADGE